MFDKDDLNDDDKGVSETSRDVALINSDQSLVSTKEKSTQEKVRKFFWILSIVLATSRIMFCLRKCIAK